MSRNPYEIWLDNRKRDITIMFPFKFYLYLFVRPAAAGALDSLNFTVDYARLP